MSIILEGPTLASHIFALMLSYVTNVMAQYTCNQHHDFSSVIFDYLLLHSVPVFHNHLPSIFNNAGI